MAAATRATTHSTTGKQGPRQGLQSTGVLLKRPSPPSLMRCYTAAPPMHGLELNKGPLTFMLVRNKKGFHQFCSTLSISSLEVLCSHFCAIVLYGLPQSKKAPRPGLYTFLKGLWLQYIYTGIAVVLGMCRTKCTGKQKKSYINMQVVLLYFCRQQ